MFLEVFHRRAHRVRGLNRIRARQLEDADRPGALAVQQTVHVVVLRAEFDSRDIAQTCGLALRAALEDDVSELFLGDQPSLHPGRQLKHVALSLRTLPEHARRNLHVLLADGGNHFASRQITR